MIGYDSSTPHYVRATAVLKAVPGEHPDPVRAAQQRLDRARALPREHTIDPRDIAAQIAQAPESEWADILTRAQATDAAAAAARNALKSGGLEKAMLRQIDQAVRDNLDHYLTLIAPHLEQHENTITTAARKLHDLDPVRAVRSGVGGALSDLTAATKAYARLLGIYPTLPRELPNSCLWVEPPANAGRVHWSGTGKTRPSNGSRWVVEQKTQHMNDASELGFDARNLVRVIDHADQHRINVLALLRGNLDGFRLYAPRTAEEYGKRVAQWQAIHETRHSGDSAA